MLSFWRQCRAAIHGLSTVRRAQSHSWRARQLLISPENYTQSGETRRRETLDHRDFVLPEPVDRLLAHGSSMRIRNFAYPRAKSAHQEPLSAIFRLNRSRLCRAGWSLSFLVGCVASLTAGAQQSSSDLSKLDPSTLTQLAVSGQVGAQSVLADHYDSGLFGWKQDRTQALHWYRKAAEQGDRHSEAKVADYYNYGRGTCQDFKQAAFWFQKAAEQGDWNAQWTLGNAYEFGRGVPRDSAQALIWIQKAAAQGEAYAKARLDRLQELAQSPNTVQINTPVEVPLVAGACDNVNLAEQNLAAMGDMVAIQDFGFKAEYAGNHDLAIKLLKRAAEYGDPLANAYLLQLTIKNYTPGKGESVDYISTALGAHSARTAGMPSEYKTVAPAAILRLLVSGDAVKLDGNSVSVPSATGIVSQRNQNLWRVCNGEKPKEPRDDPSVSGEEACYRLVQLYRLEALSASAPQKEFQLLMSALMRGCGLYAPDPDTSWGGETCGLLGLALYDLGNKDAAKAVWEFAPGCYSYDKRGGSPVNGCTNAMDEWDDDFFGAIPPTGTTNPQSLGDSTSPARTAFRSEPERLAKILWQSCTTIHDRPSCAFLQSEGAHVDMGAVDRAEQERTQALENYRAEKRAAFEQSRADSVTRRNAVLGALQQFAGDYNPNAIVNAGNQQAAAIRAIGDANAAREQQEALRLASQRATPQTTSQGTNIVAGPAPPNQGPAQVATSSPGAQSVSNSDSSATSGVIQYSTPLATSCVRQFFDPNTYNWLSFENNCGQAIYINYIPHRPGGWSMGGGMHLAPGAHNNTGLSSAEINQTGGFDLYVCPTDSVPVDLNGNVFNVNVAQYRCKPQ
jgi:TPR repeat protein